MKQAILAFALMFALFSISPAQETAETKSAGNVILRAGAEFSARLENEINAGMVKVPMDILLKTTEPVEGIGKNAEIFARVVRAEKTSKENNTSRLGVLFDFVKKDGKFLPLSASIVGLDKNAAATAAATAAQSLEFSESPTFEGGTVLSLKGKDIGLEKGTIVRIKLKEDLTEN